MLRVVNLSGFGGVVTSSGGGGGGGSPGSGVASLTYVDKSNSGSNLTTYTFNNRSFGTESVTRYIVVGVIGTNPTGRTISSVTVNGNATTIIGQAGTTTRVGIAITSSAFPTGTVGPITVTWNSAPSECAIVVYAVYDIGSTTATDTLSATGNDPSGAIDVPANGIMIAIAGTGARPNAVTWTNATEDEEDNLGSDSAYSSASHTTSTEQLARTITATFSTDVNSALYAASWAP